MSHMQPELVLMVRSGLGDPWEEWAGECVWSWSPSHSCGQESAEVAVI